MILKNFKKKKLSAVQVIVLGFFIVILVGALLLTLPISSIKGEVTNFVDALFTSTSAVCVTGLAVKNTKEYWSDFGKLVIIMLIQIGGIGFMSFTTLIAIVTGKRIGLKSRIVIQESVNGTYLQGMVRLSRYIITFTFIVEMIGAFILSFILVPQFGVKKGIAMSLFHSISAFCNAGFDLFGNSLYDYRNSTIILLGISLLIIVGGLGFSVWSDIYGYKKGNKLSTHTVVALTVTGILLVTGTILFFLIERNNPDTIGNMSLFDKMINAIFQSTTARTAGFNTYNISSMRPGSIFLTDILMFIGAAPGSTGGGIKVTTFAIIIATLASTIKGDSETNLFRRRIDQKTVVRSFLVFFVGFTIIVACVFLIRITNVNFTLEEVFFEAVSAFGTVGLSLGITPYINTAGKIILTLAMFAGRVGALTILLAIGKERMQASIRYPEGKILIG